MVVSIDLAQFQGRAERPFLAIWIEDKDKFPIRTLTVLYRDREARYLAELRQWYRADRLRAMAEGTDILGSVASATRAPGHYTFRWDMKDEQGKVVKPGSYTVCIEAAREHGTYQLMRQPIEIGNADKQVTVPINGVEVTAATPANKDARVQAAAGEVLALAPHLHVDDELCHRLFRGDGMDLEPPRSVQRPRAAPQGDWRSRHKVDRQRRGGGGKRHRGRHPRRCRCARRPDRLPRRRRPGR